MIGMFVGDDDGIKPVDVFFHCSKSRQRFAFPKPGIDKDACALCLQQRQVARTARSQNGYS